MNSISCFFKGILNFRPRFPFLRSLTHLPIMIDPSHGTGKAEYVPSMALAAIAAGTDSLMIEVHPNPAKALSDGPQSLTPERFDSLMQELAVIGKAVGLWSQPAIALAY
jgi:3-deoxy-7-phosphoheptulonate synthase